jgi:hypothetical protein
MSDEANNSLTPRQLAVAMISEKLNDVNATIDAHQAWERENNYFNSQILVFLNQVGFELRRAARHLELVDASEDEESTPP